MKSIGKLRRSQLTNVASPGAMVDFRIGGRNGVPVSAIVTGTEYWTTSGFGPPGNWRSSFSDPRLQAQLPGITKFFVPPVDDSEKDEDPKRALPVRRFPYWLQCPKCFSLRPYGGWAKDLDRSGAAYCSKCSSGPTKRTWVTAARFVAACDHGHLDDFPWSFYLHRDQPCEKPNELMLNSVGGQGLNALILSCQHCRRSTSMASALMKDGLGSCRGRRPWMRGSDTEECPAKMRGVQRGASNLHHSVTVSAITIPPFDDQLEDRFGDFWNVIMAKDATERRDVIAMAHSIGHEGLDEIPLEDLIKKVEDQIQRLGEISEGADIRADEFRVLVNPDRIKSGLGGIASFQAVPGSVPDGMTKYVSNVTLVERLREVRVLRGFSRIGAVPPTEEYHPKGRLARISAPDSNWLPAVEIFGEGIFVALDQDRVQEWETRPPVRDRLEQWVQLVRDTGDPIAELDKITSRQMLVHSLGHAMIVCLALESGYGEASLKERLFVDEDMAGVLIHTGAPDSEGTLGGLVRLGRKEPLGRLFESVMRNVEWCASDPLCSDPGIVLSDALNPAACHNCLLVAETCCDSLSNRFLDRALLVGTADEPSLGYFRD